MSSLCDIVSLWTCRIVKERLRLGSCDPRVSKQPPRRPPVPCEPRCDDLGHGALTPLQDHQDPNGDPEEEVHPHRRLRGGGGEALLWQTRTDF